MENETSLLDVSILAKSINGFIVGNDSLIFTSVTTDSRSVSTNSLFVPLIGEVQNGHKYIPQAIEKGASIIFIAEEEFNLNKDNYSQLASKNKVAFIVVKNTLKALQAAACCYLKQFPSLIKIGITGSCGKTTTKEILGSILSEKYSVLMNEGNFNSETGMPLSAFRVRKNHQIGIFEMGMNHPYEISDLANVLYPDYAIITNIGTAHIGILGSQDNIAAEKKRIFQNFTEKCKGFIHQADKYNSFLKENVKGQIIDFGKDAQNYISNFSDNGLDGISFYYEGLKSNLYLTGKHNFSNALSSIALARELGLSKEQIVNGIAKVKPLFGRNQILKGKKTIIQDCYNANPDSMATSIEFCDSLPNTSRKIYVLADMLELGEESLKEHTKIVNKAISSNAYMVLFFGNEMKKAFDNCKNTDKLVMASSSIEEISQKLKSVIQDGDLILLKGSRGMSLERLTPVIEG